MTIDFLVGHVDWVTKHFAFTISPNTIETLKAAREWL